MTKICEDGLFVLVPASLFIRLLKDRIRIALAIYMLIIIKLTTMKSILKWPITETQFLICKLSTN